MEVEVEAMSRISTSVGADQAPASPVHIQSTRLLTDVQGFMAWCVFLQQTGVLDPAKGSK